MVSEIIGALGERLARRGVYQELVFCGFGEPTMRMDALNAAGLYVRLHHPEIPLRLNTIGLGSLVQGRDIVPELALFLDSVSVSVNTADPRQWEAIHRPRPEYRSGGFSAVRSFIERCLRARIRVRMTAIELPGVDLEAVRAYARAAGAEFLARPVLTVSPASPGP